MPAEHYAAVSGWVDGNNLRGRLVYLKIGESHAPRPAEAGTLAAKIAIKQGTPFRDFLLDELGSRFDYFCCDTLEDFRRYPKALTANGQLKGGRGRHEKDDRQDLSDRRNYVLGWDNHDKISRFRAEHDEVQGELSVVAGQLARVNESLGAIWAGRTSSWASSARCRTSPRSAGSSPHAGSRTSSQEKRRAGVHQRCAAAADGQRGRGLRTAERLEDPGGRHPAPDRANEKRRQGHRRGDRGLPRRPAADAVDGRRRRAGRRRPARRRGTRRTSRSPTRTPEPWKARSAPG